MGSESRIGRVEVPKTTHGGEAGIGGHQTIGATPQGGGGKYGIERSERVGALEELQTGEQIVSINSEQRCEELRITARHRRCIASRAPTGADVDELLDDLHRRGRPYIPGLDRFDESSARCPEWMVGADCVHQH